MLYAENLFGLLESPAVYALSWTLVHFIWQGAAVGAVLWIVLRMLDRRAHELRYWVMCAALGILLVMPIATYLAVWNQMAGATTAAIESAEINPTEVPDESGAIVGLRDARSDLPSVWPISTHQAMVYMAFGWALGAGCLLIRLIGGWISVRRMVSRSTAAPSAWQARLNSLARRDGMLRPIRLRVTESAIGPCIVGFLRPTILVPLGLLTGLPPWQVEAIFAHELAHLKRFDFVVNLLQSLAEALLFYHPVVWWVSGRIRAEREYCCDDRAAGRAGGVLAYARALVSLEEFRQVPTAALGASGGSLRARIDRMLAGSSRLPGADRNVSSAAPLLITVFAAILLAACTDVLLESSVETDAVRTQTVEIEEELIEARRQYSAFKDSMDAVVASTGLRDGEDALRFGRRSLLLESAYLAALAAALERSTDSEPLLTQEDVRLAAEMASAYEKAMVTIKSLETAASPMTAQIEHLKGKLKTAEDVVRVKSRVDQSNDRILEILSTGASFRELLGR